MSDSQSKGKKSKIFKKKMEIVMTEAKAGKLHSGKNGKIVTNRAQEIAIALHEADKAAKRGSVEKPKKKK